MSVVRLLTLFMLLVFFYLCCSNEDVCFIVETANYSTYYKASCSFTFPLFLCALV